MAKRKFDRVKGVRDWDFTPPEIEVSQETKRWILIIILLTFGILLFLSLVDTAGTLGIYLNTVLKFLFGLTRWYIPIILLIISYFLIRQVKYGFSKVNALGLFIFIFSFNGLIHLAFHQSDLVPAAKAGLGGGYSGLALSWLLFKLMGFWASFVVLLAGTIIGFILLFETYFLVLLEKRQNAENVKEEKSSWRNQLNGFLMQRKIKKIQAERESLDSSAFTKSEEIEVPEFSQKIVGQEKQSSAKETKDKNVEAEKNGEQFDMGVSKYKQMKIDVPLDLLDGRTTTPKAGDIKANKVIIQKTLDNFGIQVEMGEAQTGPTVTQYTLKPAEGIKLSRITALNDNLALALAAHPIRMEAPIPGKSLIGIEVPNQATAIVPLRDILGSEEFRNRKSNLTVALGKDVMGKPWLAELEKMPHLLIAGSTGSGKSVCINSLILSLLFQNGPGDLKLIMVDPKRVELPIYNGIPHLLTPVIIDVKKTVNALRWSIKEMERRFDILSQAHHRNIASYNNASPEKMPYIVVIIDELADLMAAAGAEVEAAIVRLAQMSRAVGIHLVLATQRPSVDVLTGLIKANVTARIAFSVASLVDSRTILDMAGAEKLLGRGDMLYISAEISKPKRLQGAFASDSEIKRVIEYLKERAEPDYIEEVVEKQQVQMGEQSNFDDSDGDPLLAEAKEIIVRAKKASASFLQRRLRIGYARAARILDLLEEQGVIGPGDGAKPRDVLISSLDNDTMKDQDDFDDMDEVEVEEEGNK